MQLVSRASWGARAPRNWTSLLRAEQQGTAVHYSAADADEQALHANCAGRVRSIQNYHMDHNGWADIAYSYLACKHGYVFEGRGLGIRTAAQGTTAGNDAYHAVCFLGDDTAGRDDVTDPGRIAIRDGVLHCNNWADVVGVRPHSSFHSTACPGDQLRAWIAAGMPVQEDDMTVDELRTELSTPGTASRSAIKQLAQLAIQDELTTAGSQVRVAIRELVGLGVADKVADITAAVVAALPAGSVDAAAVKAAVTETLNATVLQVTPA